jgi:uncharacterized protein (DUF58 family)
MLAKQAVEGFITGMHKSPFHGFSVEFAEHRQYNSGESTRHLDWKLLARTDKHFVKRYEEETNLRCQILIDSSSSMFFPEGVRVEGNEFNKLKFSIYAAAALIELLKNQRDAVGLSIFSNTIEVNTRTGSSGAHIAYLYNELEKLLNTVDGGAQKKTFVTDTLHEIAENVHRRSLVIIFSDMLDNSEKSEELFSALQHLRHNKHEVILFHVTDQSKEELFEYENRPYTFTDLETGQEIKVNPADIRDTYLENMRKFKTDLKLKCGAYRIDFVEADINEGFNQILLQYLIKRQRMNAGSR